MASFSVSVDPSGPTLNVSVTASDYDTSSASVQVIRGSDGQSVSPASSTGTPPGTQSWTFNVTSGNQYTVIVTCGGESNVSIVNVP